MANSDDDFGAMLAEFESKQPKDRRRPRPGDVVSGKVVSIGNDSVFIDLGGKAEGVIERNQVSDADGALKLAIGDTIEARVAQDSGGVLVLRVKIARGPEAKGELVQAFELGIPVDGLVTEAVKGGVSVDVSGVRGFCPASQLDGRFVEDISTFVGQRLTFRITKYEVGRMANLVLSRRVLVEEEQARRAAQVRGTLVPGAVVRGRVISMKPYGAFVDLGGLEGMLHVSELGHTRVGKPEEVLSIGQEIDVQILKIEPAEKGKKGGERIALSLKSLAADPWNEASRQLSEGMRVKGTVARLEAFGAFVQIAPGVEGLVHISELGAGRRINHPREVLKVGQEVEAAVLAVDHERHRISLSLAAASDGTAADIQAAPVAPMKLGTFADLFKNKA
jgi:small subunit ribosomal protein S1